MCANGPLAGLFCGWVTVNRIETRRTGSVVVYLIESRSRHKNLRGSYGLQLIGLAPSQIRAESKNMELCLAAKQWVIRVFMHKEERFEVTVRASTAWRPFVCTSKRMFCMRYSPKWFCISKFDNIPEAQLPTPRSPWVTLSLFSTFVRW